MLDFWDSCGPVSGFGLTTSVTKTVSAQDMKGSTDVESTSVLALTASTVLASASAGASAVNVAATDVLDWSKTVVFPETLRATSAATTAAAA